MPHLFHNHRLVLIAEIIVVGLLQISWIGGALTANDQLEALSSFERAITLQLHSTPDAMTFAGGLGFVVIAVVLLRRVHALAVFIAVAVGTAVIGLFFSYVATETFAPEAALVLSAFWAACATDRWKLLTAIAAASALVGNVRAFELNDRLVDFGVQTSRFVGPANRLLAIFVLAGLGIGAGLLVRRVAEQAQLLAARNHELEIGRAASQHAAVLGERVRIARELHDVVAHHVTAMTVHAGAARQVEAMTTPSNGAIIHALESIEESGRTAIDELHRLLGFLRSDRRDNGARAPLPSLEQLSALAESVDGKLACSITVTGEASRVPEAVSVAAYRIIQEGVTNILKHSTADSATITVDCGPTTLSLSVTDPGPTARKPGEGHGVIGMQERAALLGGSLTAGVDGAGWVVAAQLPYRLELP